jgi:hypothetical protein
MPGDATSAAVSWTDLTNVPADFADTTDDVDDADADPENELQSLILDNTNLTISDKNTVNLSGFSNIWSKAGDDIFFDTGKVGIGISTPGLMANTIFDVAGRVSFRPADSTKYMIFDNIGAKQRIYTDCSVGTAYDLILGTYPKGHVNQLVLKQSNGYVGIGTADPVAKLTVASETPSTYALLQNSLTGNTASDGFALKEDGTDAYIMNYESGFIQFRTNGNRAMTIASNGNVGIGDAVPEATLKVTGTTKFGDHGTQFTEIKELSGKTDPTLNWKALTLPTGYTETNTRVLSIEINYLGNRWSGLGHDNGGGSNQSTSYILNEGLLYLYYPNLSSYMDRNVRILLMKIPTL